jgi:hypothetical protein
VGYIRPENYSSVVLKRVGLSRWVYFAAVFVKGVMGSILCVVLLSEINLDRGNICIFHWESVGVTEIIQKNTSSKLEFPNKHDKVS